MMSCFLTEEPRGVARSDTQPQAGLAVREATPERRMPGEVRRILGTVDGFRGFLPFFFLLFVGCRIPENDGLEDDFPLQLGDF